MLAYNQEDTEFEYPEVLLANQASLDRHDWRWQGTVPRSYDELLYCSKCATSLWLGILGKLDPPNRTK